MSWEPPHSLSHAPLPAFQQRFKDAQPTQPLAVPTGCRLDEPMASRPRPVTGPRRCVVPAERPKYRVHSDPPSLDQIPQEGALAHPPGAPLLQGTASHRGSVALTVGMAAWGTAPPGCLAACGSLHQEGQGMPV